MEFAGKTCCRGITKQVIITRPAIQGVSPAVADQRVIVFLAIEVVVTMVSTFQDVC